MLHIIIDQARRYINGLLSENSEVRLKQDYDHGCTIVICDGTAIATIDQTILYGGYLGLTAPGTPSRIMALEYTGTFGVPELHGILSYTCCMSHTYNDHDKVNWYDPDEGNEDAGLDASYED